MVTLTSLSLRGPQYIIFIYIYIYICIHTIYIYIHCLVHLFSLGNSPQSCFNFARILIKKYSICYILFTNPSASWSLFHSISTDLLYGCGSTTYPPGSTNIANWKWSIWRLHFLLKIRDFPACSILVDPRGGYSLNLPPKPGSSSTDPWRCQFGDLSQSGAGDDEM